MALFDDLAVAYMRRLIPDFQLEDFQAAGIVGNGGTESAGFSDVTENNPTSGRGGLGHFQWTGPRRRDFEAWLARNVDKNWQADTFEANYSMLFRELVEGGPEHAAIVALKQTRTLSEATETFCAKFERPGVINMTDRQKWADRAMAAWRAAGIDVAALRRDGRPGTQVAVPTGDALLPATGGNPIAGVVGFLQGHETEARKITLTVVGIHNALYPNDQIVVDATKAPAKSGAAQPDFLASILVLAGSLFGIDQGAIGGAFGMGVQPTGTGTLSVLGPLVTMALSFASKSSPILGTVGTVLGPVLGALGKLAPKK